MALQIPSTVLNSRYKLDYKLYNNIIGFVNETEYWLLFKIKSNRKEIKW